MATCEYPDCGRKEALPFKCRYCTKLFCTTHRLPENHDCEKLHLLTSPSTVSPILKKDNQSEISEPRKSRRQRKSEPIESEYFEPDSHYYTTDDSGQIYTTKPTRRQAMDRKLLSMVGDSFSVGRETLDFLLGLLLMILSYGLISIFMSNLPWYLLGFVSLNIILVYFSLVYPKKFLARKFGYSSRYILSKIGILINLVMAISPIKIIFFPGMVVIPEIQFMTKRQRGLVSSIGLVINLALGLTFILLGWFLLNEFAAAFFVNAAFFASQIVLISLIPFRLSNGHYILKWHWSIFTVMIISALAIFIGTIILGVFAF
ncbi:MAG: hypothetical protein KGD59_05400 [Candidatus Heimdallarchaeota archaeon]|nr:hypothetical protein [Candidatus Heimdallarchaeota archaeon]